jgi:hypothetical protein
VCIQLESDCFEDDYTKLKVSVNKYPLYRISSIICQTSYEWLPAQRFYLALQKALVIQCMKCQKCTITVVEDTVKAITVHIVIRNQAIDD